MRCCSAKVRRHLQQLSEQVLPRLAVFSYNEIQPEVDIRAAGTVSLDVAADQVAA